MNTPEKPATKAAPVPPLPDWLAPLLSVGLTLLLLAHLAGKLAVDTTALALIGLILLSWLLPLLSKLKVGGVEIELRERVTQLEQQTEAIVEAAAGPEHEISLLRAKDGSPPTLADVLASGPYVFRSLSALSAATGRKPVEVAADLAVMVADGQVVAVQGKDGRRLWGLSARGRSRP